jgi:FtsH-binding integral membrane protein
MFGKSRSQRGGGSLKNLMQLLVDKKEFFILVFANLIVQCGITYYVMEKTNTNVSTLPLFIAAFILIFVIALVPMPSFVKFLLFCLFSYIIGLIMSIYKKKYNATMINTAIKGALSVFAMFLAIGVVLVLGGIRLGYKFGAFLFFALLALIVAQLVFILGAGLTWANKALSAIGIVIFALYVLYDTNQILQRDYMGDFITASMDYYLDIINLFSNLLVFNNS